MLLMTLKGAAGRLQGIMKCNSACFFHDVGFPSSLTQFALLCCAVLVCAQKGKRARDVATLPALRALFKAFDLSLAAARNYTRHHAERLAAAGASASNASASAADITSAAMESNDHARSPSSSAAGVDAGAGAVERLWSGNGHSAPAPTSTSGLATSLAKPPVLSAPCGPVWSPQSPSRPAPHRHQLMSPLASLDALASFSSTVMPSPSPLKPSKRTRRHQVKADLFGAGGSFPIGTVTGAGTPAGQDSSAVSYSVHLSREDRSAVMPTAMTDKLLDVIASLERRVDALQTAQERQDSRDRNSDLRLPSSFQAQQEGSGLLNKRNKAAAPRLSAETRRDWEGSDLDDAPTLLERVVDEFYLVFAAVVLLSVGYGALQMMLHVQAW